MVELKQAYMCTECGSQVGKWQGQCPECSAWNSLTECSVSKKSVKSKSRSYSSYSGTKTLSVQKLSEVKLGEIPRFTSGFSEFDRVLGGGIVPGSVILLGGAPGIGKSSILLQVMCSLSMSMNALYVTGEESMQQVALRADRMLLPKDNLQVLNETEISSMLHHAQQVKPEIIVVDSIQTAYLSELTTAAGGVSQVKESAAALTRFAKTTNTTIILVGHVTKSGEVAGPRVLEHIVDAVVYLEGQSDSPYRMMRSMKNRFGAVNELGVFAMTDTGMKEVKNPSAIFLSRTDQIAPGSVVSIVWEGSRPLLIELQALVDDNQFGQPRRVSIGVDQQRLIMLLAILHRHGGVPLGDQDVFINIVGGVKVTETALDLALLLSMTSSFRNKSLPESLIVLGEVGLSGEIRPVPNGQSRLKEAVKHGFKTAIIPYQNKPPKAFKGLEIILVKNLSDALAVI